MRIMIAGTHSGCGKTVLTLALMATLSARGMRVAPFKTGPDYIDAGFHALACGRPSHNLDEHLLDWETMRFLLRRYGECADISIIEGVMGFYDGRDAASFECSSYELARRTHTPVLLAVDASGGAASVAAQVLGFARLAPDNTIAGVIVNKVASRAHYALVRDAVRRFAGVECVGYLPNDASLRLNSRHLGLVPAEELSGLRAQLKRASALASECIDLNAVRDLAAAAPELDAPGCAMTRWLAANPGALGGMRIGLARDAAFSFYYQANLDALEQAGARLTRFSPLADAELPAGLDALYIGGGFPEVFARQLEANAAMRAQVRAALEGGLRCYAECGGLIYLSERVDGHEMVGYMPVECTLTDRLQRFGYVHVRDAGGFEFPAHEFHHAIAAPTRDVDCEFEVTRSGGPGQWRCGYRRGNALAGFPHIHFWSRPEVMARLFGTARGN